MASQGGGSSQVTTAAFSGSTKDGKKTALSWLDKWLEQLERPAFKEWPDDAATDEEHDGG